MRKFYSFIVPLSLLVYSLEANSAVDLSTLIKVTKENNPKCVEYYNYMGSVYCSTTAQNPQPVDPQLKNYEKQNIVFDDRVWQPAWGQQSEEITAIEYVPSGDNVEQWHELVTSQFIPGLEDSITAIQYADSVIQQLKKSGLQSKISILEKTPDHVLLEFHILAPENLKQDELQLITRGSDGFYILHYAIKKEDMGEKNRAKWIENLKNSKIKLN